MYEELICGFILWIVIFIFIIVTGHEVFSIMVAEKSRNLRLVIHNAPLPATLRSPVKPEPVARYIAWAGGTNPKSFWCLHIRHAGRMRFGKTGRWMTMGGEMSLALAAPGFVWHATIACAPGIWLEAFDYYVRPDVGMHISLFSLLPLNNSQDPAMRTPFLSRYLASLPLFPMVHGTSDFIQWENIDDSTARAIIHDGENSAEAIVRFNGKGWIESITPDKKMHLSPGKPVAGPVDFRFSSYREMDGYRIPIQIASDVILPDGKTAFFEFSVTEIEFDNVGRKHEA
jgi:hypothetical protein